MSQEVPPEMNSKSVYDGRVIRSFKTAVINADRIIVLLLFGAFGVYSWFDPSPSMTRLTTIPEHATYLLFIFTTVFMLIGYFYNNFEVFVAGHIFGIMGCLTVGGVVIITTDSPVALLVICLGLMLLVSLKRIFIDRKMLMQVASTTQPLELPEIPDPDEKDERNEKE